MNANSKKVGSFNADTHTFSGASEGSVFIGRGGNDTLAFSGINSSNVTFDPTNRRTVFGGTTFDWLRVNSTGQEIYFQGYDRLQFSNSTINLGETPNDPLFPQQWNLGMMDVPGAWRFTTGSNSVMIGVADTGLQFNNGQLSSQDLGGLGTKSLADTSDNDSNLNGHGTSVQSIIAAQSNNGVGISGINWNSQVQVSRVFDQNSINLYTAFQQLVNAAGTNRKSILNYSGSSNPIGDANNNFVRKSNEDIDLRSVISNNASNALFIASSGNSFATGGTGAKYPTNVVSQPADFAGSFGNAIAVGAIDQFGRRYDYSQYGAELTFVAPSGVPAERIPTTTITDGERNVYDIVSDPRFHPISARKRSDGQIYTFSGFGGTSAAAPNASGVASLVWSANTNLVAYDIKSILTGTANRVWESWGGSNSDNQYGAGLIDAEAAVRRANALNLNRNVASLYNHEGILFV